MRGKNFCYINNSTGSDVDPVEKATAQYKEECELRLARITNGADPRYKNGTAWEEAQRIASISKDTRLAGSPRKAKI